MGGTTSKWKFTCKLFTTNNSSIGIADNNASDSYTPAAHQVYLMQFGGDSSAAAAYLCTSSGILKGESSALEAMLSKMKNLYTFRQQVLVDGLKISLRDFTVQLGNVIVGSSTNKGFFLLLTYEPCNRIDLLPSDLGEIVLKELLTGNLKIPGTQGEETSSLNLDSIPSHLNYADDRSLAVQIIGSLRRHEIL